MIAFLFYIFLLLVFVPGLCRRMFPPITVTHEPPAPTVQVSTPQIVIHVHLKGSGCLRAT